LPATNELSVAMPLRCVCTSGDGIAWEQEAVKVLEAQGWRWRLVYLAFLREKHRSTRWRWKCGIASEFGNDSGVGGTQKHKSSRGFMNRTSLDQCSPGHQRYLYSLHWSKNTG